MKTSALLASLLFLTGSVFAEDAFEFLVSASHETPPAGNTTLTLASLPQHADWQPFSNVNLNVDGLNPDAGQVYVEFSAHDWTVRAKAESTGAHAVSVVVPPLYSAGHFVRAHVTFTLVQNGRRSRALAGPAIASFGAVSSPAGAATRSLLRVALATLLAAQNNARNSPLNSPDLQRSCDDLRAALETRLAACAALRAHALSEIELGASSRCAYHATFRNLAESDRMIAAAMRAAAGTDGLKVNLQKPAFDWAAALSSGSETELASAEHTFIQALQPELALSVEGRDSSDFEALGEFFRRIQLTQAAVSLSTSSDALRPAPRLIQSNAAASALLAASGMNAFAAGAEIMQTLIAYREAAELTSTHAADFLESAAAGAEGFAANSTLDPASLLAAHAVAAARAALARKLVPLDPVVVTRNTFTLSNSASTPATVNILLNGNLIADNLQLTPTPIALPLIGLEGPSNTLAIVAVNGPVSASLVVDTAVRSLALAPGQAAVLAVPRAETCESKVVDKAPGDPNPARTMLGIGESVKVSCKQKALFSLGGDGSITNSSGTKTTYIAPTQAGMGQLFCYFPPDFSNSVEIDFTTIVPNGLLFHNTGKAAKISKTDYGVGMNLEVTVAPTTVSFHNAAIKEDDVAASPITGYFSTFNPSSSTFASHSPNPKFETIDKENKYKDLASTSFTLPAALKATLATSGGGSFTFNIPVRYKALQDGGSGTTFITVPQVFSITPDGTMTVSKGGATATRAGPK